MSSIVLVAREVMAASDQVDGVMEERLNSAFSTYFAPCAADSIAAITEAVAVC